MFLCLGAVMGARLHSLPHCCSDADLHQLVMWSKIVFQSSSDMDQTCCSFGKPIGLISYLFQVARPGFGSGWEKNASQKAAHWHLPRLHFMSITFRVWRYSPQGRGLLVNTACKMFSACTPQHCRPKGLVGLDSTNQWGWKQPKLIRSYLHLRCLVAPAFVYYHV